MSAFGPLIHDVYLDTSVVAATVIAGSPHHLAARAFCDEIVRSELNVYISQFLSLELLQAIRTIATDPAALPEITRRCHRLERWGVDLDVREAWMDYGVREYDALCQSFVNFFEIPMRSEDWRNSIALMCQYHLKSYDACHAATALALGVHDLATIDAHFTRVSELTVHLIRNPEPSSNASPGDASQ